MIDVQHQLNAVRRTVGRTTFEARAARVVSVSQTYDTDAADLWDACTSLDRIPRWFLPITGDLQVGGRFQLEGNASGEVLTCEPPRSFTTTWESMGATSWVEVTIAAVGENRATFTLDHIMHADDDDEFWLQFGPGAVGVGWDSGLLGLAGYLSGGDGITPEEGAAWAAGAEGRAFMAGASELWYQAALAAGEDPAQARAAADRTTEAYTAG